MEKTKVIRIRFPAARRNSSEFCMEGMKDMRKLNKNRFLHDVFGNFALIICTACACRNRNV